MKIFVFGPNGMLGRYVYSYFKNEGFNVVGIDRSSIDITTTCYDDLDFILDCAEIESGDVIINCAGLIKQRVGTKTFDFTMVNSIFPYLLSSACESFGCRLIHITTDCVFDGLKGSYNELSPRTATDVYGVSKSLGEPEEATIIRTSIIGEELSNFSSLLEWVKSNKDKEVKGFTNHVWNGITCLQFAKICRDIITHDLYWYGVRHVFSPDTFNKCELIKLISNIYKLGVKVTPIITDTMCDRSLSTIYSDVSFDIPTLGTQLVELKEFYPKLVKEVEVWKTDFLK